LPNENLNGYASLLSNTVPLVNSPLYCTLTEDGGVVKKVLKQGKGEIPPQGSMVSVQYRGEFTNGTVFDSSDAYPFKFQLGKGKVIKGWDIAVATMAVGENSQLTVTGNYAYGSDGIPGEIPPNATLIFNVELLSFEESSPETESVSQDVDKDRIERKKVLEEVNKRKAAAAERAKQMNEKRGKGKPGAKKKK